MSLTNGYKKLLTLYLGTIFGILNIELLTQKKTSTKKSLLHDFFI